MAKLYRPPYPSGPRESKVATAPAAAIEQDGFDRLVYGQAIQDLAELRDLDSRSEQASAVLRDVHASLYKTRPALCEAGEGEPQHRGVIEQMMGTAEYARLRATTKMSELGSAIGTLELGNSLLDHLSNDDREHEARRRRRASAGQDPGPALEGVPGRRGGPLLRDCASREDQRRLLRRIVQEAQERTEESVEAMAALQGCGTGTEQGSPSDLASAVALAQRLRRDPRLRKIARLAGRMRLAAVGKRQTRFRHGPDDVIGVELGNDLSRLLPNELQALVTPELELDAMVRLTQRRMLQVKREGKERRQQGPVVVLVDESSSMRGDKDVWAKALALGVMSIARREFREFACGTFNKECELRTWGKRPEMIQVLEFLSRSPSGGTSFSKPLGRAMDLIEGAREGETWSKADIVFITDGEAELTEEFVARLRRRMEATGTHLYSIAIGSRAESLDAFSDGVAFVQDLEQDGEALSLAFGI